MIRVVIAVDSPELRSALVAMFGAEPDVRVVEEEYEADVTVRTALRSGPRDGVADHDEGDLDARVTRPATIVLLERMDAEAAREAYGSGAIAALAIAVDPDVLLGAIPAADS